MPPHVPSSAETAPAPQDADSSKSPSTAEPSSSGRAFRNNPSAVAPVHVDVEAPAHERDAQIEAAVRAICPDAVARDADGRHPTTRRLSVRQLGGGLSNHLFVVASPRDGAPPSLLVRVHGEGDESDECGFVDRSAENRVLARLSSVGLAPVFHGRFRNGRVEEFYEGYRPLSFGEMADGRFAGGVAEAMALLHRTAMPEGVLPDAGEGGDIWGRVDGWFDMARGDNDSAESDGDENASLEELRSEWAWLKSELRSPPKSPDEAVAFCRQVVFAHMDCQSLNILTPSSSSSPGGSSEDGGAEAPVRLIDFEYSALNPRAADIANTFCEHCDMNNLAADYESQYPTAEQQNFFLRRYISRVDPELARRLDVVGGESGGWGDFLSSMRAEVGRHALISHLGWAVWALAQQRRGCGIEFDYGAYAALRIEGYRLFKGWFWAGTSALSSSGGKESRL